VRGLGACPRMCGTGLSSYGPILWWHNAAVDIRSNGRR